MLRETPVLAGMTETTTGNIEPPNFCRNRRAEKNQNESTQDRQSAAIEKPEDQCESAENLQPGQIEGEPNADGPGQNFVVVDIEPEADWIEHLDRAGVNENTANDEVDDAPEETARGKGHFLEKKATPNVQRRTSNAQWQNQTAALDVER